MICEFYVSKAGFFFKSHGDRTAGLTFVQLEIRETKERPFPKRISQNGEKQESSDS